MVAVLLTRMRVLAPLAWVWSGTTTFLALEIVEDGGLALFLFIARLGGVV